MIAARGRTKVETHGGSTRTRYVGRTRRGTPSVLDTLDDALRLAQREVEAARAELARVRASVDGRPLYALSADERRELARARQVMLDHAALAKRMLDGLLAGDVS